VHPDRATMHSDPRHQRAGRQQHDAGAVTTQSWIEFQRSRHQGRRSDAAAAVANHHDLVGGVGFRDVDEAMRAGLDATVPAGRLAARIFADVVRVHETRHDEKGLVVFLPKKIHDVRGNFGVETLPFQRLEPMTRDVFYSIPHDTACKRYMAIWIVDVTSE